jgi:hypothetical protein
MKPYTMRPAQIEAWVLHLVDRVVAGERIEDVRVELKAQWPEAKAAARRIAGHANSSAGDPVLWVIGLDEIKGVVPISPIELADWRAQVEAEFDGIAPEFIDLAVPTETGTLVGLLFDTSRRPYVVKNPVFGKRGGGPASLEVPWRSGTAVRSAKREDLIRLLAPLPSPLEQRRQRTAQASLDELGDDGRVVLDFLLLHGSMAFGLSSPPAPTGISMQRVREILDRCQQNNLVTRSEIPTPGGRETVYTIAIGMKAALEELL